MSHKQQALKIAAKIGKVIGANKAAMQQPCPEYQSEDGYKVTLASIQEIARSLEEDLSLALSYCK